MAIAEQFDPIVWRSHASAATPVEGYDSVFTIHGPMDACTVVEIRQVLKDHLVLGGETPADLFILSAGEAFDRAATKIGGAPYWRKSRPWPRGARNEPLPFLAQFNMTASRDIATAFGDMTLVFSHPNPRMGCMAFWETFCESEDLIAPEEVPVPAEAPRLFGTRWRTSNFLDWSTFDGDQPDMIRVGERNISGLYFIYELLGMQISKHGFIPSGSKIAASNEEIICSLSGISICPERIYPLLNVAQSFDETATEHYLMPLSSIDDDDGFGIIFVVSDKNGNLRCVHRNM